MMGATSKCYSVLLLLVLVSLAHGRPVYICSSPSEAIEGEYLLKFAPSETNTQAGFSVEGLHGRDNEGRLEQMLNSLLERLERLENETLEHLENHTHSWNFTHPEHDSYNYTHPEHDSHNSTHHGSYNFTHRGNRRMRRPRLTHYKHLGMGAARSCGRPHFDELMSSDLFSHVECNMPVYATSISPSKSWGLDRVTTTRGMLDGRNGYDAPNQRGAGIHIAVIDTGINTAHVEFAAPPGWTAPSVAGISLIQGTRIAANGNGSACFSETCAVTGISDGNGHGTHTAGTAAGLTYGMAPDAVIHAIAVLDASGSGTDDGVIDGINYVTSLKATTGAPFVISMSLGGSFSQSVNDAVQAAINKGVVVVVASGNSGADASYFSPASVSQAITVGATYNNDTRAEWSNYGSYVDIYAPGVAITSAWIGSSRAHLVLSGTSMATPHVSGAVAIYLSQTGTNPSSATGVSAVASAIISQSTADAVKGNRAGTPNVLLYAPCRNGACCNETGELGGTGTCSGQCSHCSASSDMCQSSGCTLSASCSITSCNSSGSCVTSFAVAGTSCAPPGTNNPCSTYTCDGAGACISNPITDGTSCGTSSACASHQCQSGSCVLVNVPNGTPCGTTQVCYTTPVCNAGFCQQSPLPTGTACAGSGVLSTCRSYQCSATHNCVAGYAPVGSACRISSRLFGTCNRSGTCRLNSRRF